MNEKKRNLLYILSFIAIVVIAISLTIFFAMSISKKPSVVHNIASIGEASYYTDKIHTGMSYKEVATIMNREGDKWYKRNTNNNKTIMLCQWVNNNGSRLLVLFEEDKLVQKEIFIPQSIAALLQLRQKRF